MRPAASSHPDRVTQAQAKAQLALMLSAMPDHRLASHSVDSLSAINRTPRGDIAVMLAAERGRRGA